MESSEKRRDYGFDNIKLLLIILVVFGHITEEISVSGYLGVIRSCIYSFHMPLFVFISGYFSSRSRNKISSASGSYLIPYFVFNTVYALLIMHIWKINIFVPLYAFWYLLSLFFWNISIDYIAGLRPLLLISFIIGLYCGLFGNIDRLLSLSRTLCFFPFFIMGYNTGKERTEKLRSVCKPVPAVCISAALIITAVLNYKGIIPVKMYEMAESYQNTGVGNIRGILLRAVIYIIAAVLIFSIISIIPDKEYRFTVYGTRTVCIYIFSSFLIKIIFKVISMADISFIFASPAAETAFCVIMTVLIVLITGSKLSFKAYSAFIKMINKLLISHKSAGKSKTDE